MKLFPAIDIKDGRVVRLTHGDYQRVEVYQPTPLEAARSFGKAGVSCLHIVDLDGAKDGALSNFPLIAEVLANCGLFCEVGGGIRDMQRAELYIEAGAGRVILGTAALKDPDFLRQALRRFGEKIAVGVDARQGKVAVSGWLETTEQDSFGFCRDLAQLGVSTVIYTDISRDGALAGTNLPAYQRLSAISGLDIVASGGISSLEEIAALRDMGIAAAILGKALYAGQIDLRQALAVAAGKEPL